MKKVVALLLAIMLFAMYPASAASGRRITLEGMVSVTGGRATLTLVNPPDVCAARISVSPIPRAALDGRMVRASGVLAGSQLKDADVTELPDAKSVSVAPKKATVRAGEACVLVATAKPLAASQVFEWKSSAPLVASVSQDGQVTALAPGKAKITAKTLNGKTAACTITVPVPVAGVSLSKAVLNLVLNKKAVLKATVLPANAADKRVSWSSDNPAVATVSAKGSVKGVSAGTATITAVTRDGGFVGECRVSVGVRLRDLTFRGWPGSKWFDEFYVRTLSNHVIELDPDPSEALIPQCVWTSSNEAVVSVTNQGVISAKAQGIAIVTADPGVKNVYGRKLWTSGVVIVTDQPIAERAPITAEDRAFSMNGKTVQLGMSLAEIQALFPGGKHGKRNGGKLYTAGKWQFAFLPGNGKLWCVDAFGETGLRTKRGVTAGDPVLSVFEQYGVPRAISYEDAGKIVSIHYYPLLITVDTTTQRITGFSLMDDEI